MRMKLKANINYTDFLLQARKCQGDISFHSKDGDQLNLKSILSQYVFVTAAITSNLVLDGNVICENDADYKIICEFVEEI